MELGTGLIIDIIAAAIVLGSAFFGARKGFARTVASFMQWFVCIIFGFIFCKSLRDILMDYTQLDDYINTLTLNHIETTIEESSTYLALPDLFSSWIRRGTEDFSYGTAASITASIMTVISFLLIIFGLKLIGFLLVQAFSRKYNEGITGFIDGFVGFLFGLARGLILVLLFFAFLVPVLSMMWPDLAESITGAMDKSFAAKFLYDGNVLLILVRDLFS